MMSTEGFFIFKIKWGLSQRKVENEVSALARFILYENRLIEQEKSVRCRIKGVRNKWFEFRENAREGFLSPSTKKLSV